MTITIAAMTTITMIITIAAMTTITMIITIAAMTTTILTSIRHQYSESEVANFSSLNVDQLIGKVNNLLEHEFYGKAVPLLEIIAKKLQQEKDISEEHKNILLKHNIT